MRREIKSNKTKTSCVIIAYSKYPACVWTTPFGLPVLPEVYKTNKGSSLFMGSAGQCFSLVDMT